MGISHKLQRTMMMILFLLFATMTVSHAISCFECSSVDDNFCPEAMSSDDEDIVELKDCGSSLYEATYCVKTTGVEGGSLGTRRFCSSRDLGNYCDFIKRPGDQLEYRSCIYTCTGNGCNGAFSITTSPQILITFTTSVLAIIFPILVAPLLNIN